MDFQKAVLEGRGFKPNIFDKFVDSTMIGTNRRFYLTGLRENQAKSLLNYRLAVNTVGLLAN
ncbi:hypothetical protein [Moorena bouillonii]|uniref:Uncharacterized protein n=1 Tax=Moorena bouillonii PNG TaxID=568701 RepID=A0A1U7MXZ0_9CYAN|nr:hypothetical protein [Moorena bouillonii]OLT58549.1 hypothetical protein BJP37_05340 [Moorena bouillonii PNG]